MNLIRRRSDGTHPTDLDDAEWRALCADFKSNYLRVIKPKVAGDVRRSRTLQVIEPLLRSKHPSGHLLTVAKGLLRDVELHEVRDRRLRGIEKPTYQQAVLYRDALIFLLISLNPLRALQFRTMKWGENLTKEADGSWWIAFPKEAFKNRASIKGDYRVEVSPKLWPFIEEYRAKYHPILTADAKKEVADLVVVARRKLGGSARRFTVPGLDAVFQRRGQTYLGVAIGPHVARYLVATDIIKSNPEFGFVLAARALHDRQETVERAYAHVATFEEFRPVLRFFEGRFAEVFTP